MFVNSQIVQTLSIRFVHIDERPGTALANKCSFCGTRKAQPKLCHPETKKFLNEKGKKHI